MIRNIIYVVALAALGAAAGAGEDGYEYPPEYDELFKRFRPLTREEVLMLISAQGTPPGDGWARSPILEPICIKSVEEEICNYWVMSYEGDDARVRGAAEELIAMLNADDGFDPYKFLTLREILYTHSREFNDFFVYGWTWDCGIGLWGESIPGFLYDFESYLYFAEALYGEGNILKTKILVTGIQPWGWLYAFNVRDAGRRYIYNYPENSYGGTGRGEIDENGIREVALGRMARLYDHYKQTPEHYDQAEAKWAETLEYIKKNAVKEGGYYRLQYLREE